MAVQYPQFLFICYLKIERGRGILILWETFLVMSAILISCANGSLTDGSM